ncbi:hypothetical protein OS187_12795 [Xanthomonadaceae bacterium JHOS43]|jgi:hypothetical protein|nr:hypothetical protein [Xanthomonadaceae bacterium JHOS43]
MSDRGLDMMIVLLAIAVLVAPWLVYLRMNRLPEQAHPEYTATGLSSHLDECRLRGDILHVRGWAFIPNERKTGVIEVYARTLDGDYLRLPSRIERRHDIARKHQRDDTPWAVFDGFTAAARVGHRLTTPAQVVLVRTDRNGKRHGAEHACR